MLVYLTPGQTVRQFTGDESRATANPPTGRPTTIEEAR